MAGYDYSQYCAMIADASRVAPHLRALEKAVKQDSVVLDLGAGTGFMTIQVCKLGARKVYAIEGNPLIRVARTLAGTYGYSDRIEFFQAESRNVEIPEKVDILLCDLRGIMPMALSSIPDVIDARVRFLKPDGIMIANSDVVRFGLATARDYYHANISRYLDEFSGIDLSPFKYLLVNRILVPRQDQIEVVSDPRSFAEIDYRSVNEVNFDRELEWQIDTERMIHGVYGWFDVDLGFGEAITTSHMNLGHVWGNPFFPFEEPIHVRPGDKLTVAIKAFINGGFYDWSWDTKLFPASKNQEPILSFGQSTSVGNVTVPLDLEKRSEFFLPKPNETAELNKLFLNAMGADEVMLGDIADKLLETFPQRFETFDQAMQAAASLSEQYSV